MIVEVLGYGGESEETPDNSEEERRRRRRGQQSYDPGSKFRVIGNGN
jgi:hypothetical protein